MPLHKNEVGSVLYVWTQRKGQQSAGVVEVVITAHGEDRPATMNGMELAPDCMLVFYGPHGQILNALPLETTLSGQALPTEYTKSRQSQDYWLTKYTNSGDEPKHNAKGETYAGIARMDDYFRNQFEDYDRIITQVGQTPNLSRYAQESLADSKWNKERYKTLSKDVVTIRSRSGSDKGIYLSTVLNTLRAQGYNYQYVHCNFCRGAGGPHNQERYTRAIQDAPSQR